MGWLFGSSTGGERAADTRAYESQQNREHQARMGDVNWERSLMKDYNDRNQKHKMATFETEKQEARRENRQPRLWSPEQVPDIPLPSELRPPVKTPREPFRFEGFSANDLKMFKWLGIIVLLFAPFGITLQIVAGWPGIISIPVMAAVLLMEVWLVLRYLAKGDAAKLAKAEKLNPLNVARTSTAWVKSKAAGQKGSSTLSAQFSQRQDYRPDHKE
ncbi:hypothetical protein [Pseudarthrobacter sp. AB1]|uniref:hypothetical protein n=1 Tax=Pseudarthrobacter sp. AB1 TaxID=2138309 RepID=UPI00186B623C|nr:hypothetical protein [Pseudarthrobacter sp. AB1]MBE4720509.1 hypothetical protein [Pseudarthrobacter sp. AB1]